VPDPGFLLFDKCRRYVGHGVADEPPLPLQVQQQTSFLDQALLFVRGSRKPWIWCKWVFIHLLIKKRRIGRQYRWRDQQTLTASVIHRIESPQRYE
jgi:hypothetical protein